MRIENIPPDPLKGFRQGGVIPAHPLALDANRKLDVRRQRTLTRYYLDAGAIGLAVGVHTTQFEIRQHDLLRPVLQLAAEEAASWVSDQRLLVAGVVGPTAQAVAEAQLADELGYHAVLLSLAGHEYNIDALIEHCRAVGEVMPLIGFYLQPAVGGRVLPQEFWRRFAKLDSVLGIKIAPFNRYHTLDVVRGVVEAGAEDRVSLYTGNDDHIVADLLTPFKMKRNGRIITVRIVGGLLGHWSVWTQKAVELVSNVKALDADKPLDSDWLSMDAATTDCNAAFFDAANGFEGVIAGLHEVLRRQGLLEGIWCLDENETLGPGQMQEIDRVYSNYPDMNDDKFIAANLERWLAE